MSCNLENIKDDNLRALVEAYGAKEGLIKFLNGEKHTVKDIDNDVKGLLPEDSEALKNGSKDLIISLRKVNHKNFLDGKTSYSVNPQGVYTLDEYLSTTGLSKGEVMSQLLDSYDVVAAQKFLEGTVGAFIYRLTPQNENASYQREIKRLEGLLKFLESKVKQKSDQNQKQYYRDKIKDTKTLIDYLSKTENQDNARVLALAGAEITLAEDLVDEGDIITAQHYLNFYQDFIPKDLVSEELNKEKDILNKRMSDLKEKIYKLSVLHIAKSSKSQNLVDENGDPIPFKQDNTISSSVFDASVSNNPFIRDLYARVAGVINNFRAKLTLTKKEIDKYKEGVIKYQKKLGVPKDKIWDFMLQVNDLTGEKSGYTVDKYNSTYYADRTSKQVNIETASNKEINEYLDWLKENHEIEINQEAFEGYKQSQINWLNSQEIILDESKYRSEEAIENARTNKKLDRIAGRLKKIDPNTFKAIVNKPKRTSKDLDFIKNYLNPSIWKSFNGKPILEYKVINEAYLDPKYNELLSLEDTNPLKQWYQFYTNLIKTARMESNDWEQDNHLALNYIPELKMEATFLNKLPDWLKESLTELPEAPSTYLKDPVTGEPLMTIRDAGMMTGRMNPKYRNYDLGEVLTKFIEGHLSKKYKSSVEDDAKMILNIVKNQPEYETDSRGNIRYDGEVPLIRQSIKNNAYEIGKYHIEALLYDKRQLKQGSVGGTYYDSVTQAEISDLEAQGVEMLTEEEKKRLGELKGKGTVVTIKKTINALIAYTATKALALNPFSGIAETVQAFLSLYIESAGNKFFTTSDLIEGYGKALKMINPAGVVLPSGVSDYLTSSRTKSEAEKWFSNFPLLNGYGYEATSGAVSKTFVGFDTSEKLSKGAMLFAYLKNKPIKDKEGIEHKLLDVLKFDENNTAYLDDRFEDNFGLESKFKNEVVNELASISKKLMSRDNMKDPIQLNKGAVGRLLGQFRASWMFEGFLRRWGAEHEDAILGKQKGYYRSVFFTDDKPDIKKAMDILWTAWKNPENLKGKYGMEDLDVNNVKKALRELQIFTTLLTTYLTFSLLGGDDDDETPFSEMASNFLINLSYRANRDLTFYINPKSTTEVFDSPAAAMTTVKQLLQFTQAVVETPFDPYVYEGTKKEKLKVINSGSKLVPMLSGMKSTINKIVE